MGSVGGDESRETAVRPADAQEAQCNAIRFVADAHDEHVWQKRFCDFNVWNERKRVEKLRYMHRNPVKRGLVESVGVEQFSSIRLRRTRRVRVNFQEWKLKIKSRKREAFGQESRAS